MAASEGVRSVEKLPPRWSGHQLLADATVEVDPALSVVDAHTVAHRAESNLTGRCRGCRPAVIHTQPPNAHC